MMQVNVPRHSLCFSVAVLLIAMTAVLGGPAYAETIPGQGGENPGAGAIADAAGRRISVTRPYRRIISLYGAHTENIFSLNAADRLIGVGRHDDWPREAAALPVFSYHDDPEKFIAARPDLVLIRPMIDRGYGRLMSQLEAHGITVVSLQPTSIEAMLDYWRTLGILTGRRREAEAMVRQFTQTVDRIRDLTTHLHPKKRVYFEAIHARMRTFAPDAMPIFALETAGGRNVAVDAPSRRGTNIADYGKERILSQGEKIDVYLAQVGPMNRPTVASIKAEPGFQLIRAVRENHIYLIDEQLVSRPTLRMLTGIRDIGRLLYPQIFEKEIEMTGGRANGPADAPAPRSPKSKDKEKRQ